MGDMGDVFNDMRQRAKEKRVQNTIYSTSLLDSKGVNYVTHNGGAHLMISEAGAIIDYWPSTGLWICRGNPYKHRGVQSLLRYLGK